MKTISYDLNKASAEIAKVEAEKFTDFPRFVAGAIGPTNRTASLSPDVNDPGFRNVNFDELRDILYERVKAMHVKRYPYNNFLY